MLRQRPIFLFIPPAWQRCRRHSPLPFRHFCLFFFFQKKGKSKMRIKGRRCSLLFRRFLSLFFQEKENQKEKQKRKMRPSFSPLFSFLFFFKKGKKGSGKGRCGVQGIAFSAIFVLFFVKEISKRRAKRRELPFGSFFVFLERRERRRREARRLAGRLSPSM